MAKVLFRNGNGSRSAQASKYDAQNTVLSKTYGALADLRRELADSKAVVAEREELLRSFAACADSQRAWLLLEDYFEKLSLSRKDFPRLAAWRHGVSGSDPAPPGRGESDKIPPGSPPPARTSASPSRLRLPPFGFGSAGR